MPCRRYIVQGLVQGVFYRAATQQTAQRLGLTGWVRNLPDGGVELVVCGDEMKLKELEKWLWQGPRNAVVERVSGNDIAPQAFPGFSIIH
jgi:acylphosphatase